MHGARLGSRPVAHEAGGSPLPSTGAGWHEINTMLCLYPQETASMGEVILGGALGGGFGIQDVCSGFALPRLDAADKVKKSKRGSHRREGSSAPPSLAVPGWAQTRLTL